MVIEFKGKPLTEDQLMAALSMMAQTDLQFIPSIDKPFNVEREEITPFQKYRESREKHLESFESFDPNVQAGYQNKVYIGPNKRVCGLDSLKGEEINYPNSVGMTPFQVALALRDLDALVTIVQAEDFKLCQSSDTSHKSLLQLGARPASVIAKNLTEFLKLTENFHPPKPMDEVEETILIKFAKSIDALGAPNHNEKACQEVLDIFKTNLSGCAVADFEARQRGDCGITISVFDPHTREMIDADALDLLDEMYYREGHQVPKQDRWILRAIHLTNHEIDMPETHGRKEDVALGKLKELLGSSEFISQEYIYRLFDKLSPKDIEEGLGLISDIGSRHRTQQKSVKATDATGKAEKTQGKRSSKDYSSQAIRAIKDKAAVLSGPFAGLGGFSSNQTPNRENYGGVDISKHALRASKSGSKTTTKAGSILEKSSKITDDQLEKENNYNL